MNSRFHELAAAEFAEAVAYYDTRTEGLGDRLVAEVRAAVVYIEKFPESSPIIDYRSDGRSWQSFPTISSTLWKAQKS